MKRIILMIGCILFISFCLSFFVQAEEKSINDIDPIKSVKIDTTMMNDKAITKLNFFKKNINVVVIYE